MNLEKEIKINKILMILLITLSVGTIALRTSHAMFSKKETFNNVLRIITGSELPSKGATEDLIKKAGVAGEGLQGIDPETGTLCDSDCKEYRYTGASVKNYVKLTNLNPTDVTKTQEETWRIIGVFTDEDNGEKYMRIVRDEILSESYLPENFVINEKNYKIKDYDINVHWNYLTGTDDDKNNWSTAGLQYYLNREKDSNGNKGYMSYLSDETKAMLRETKHYLGNVLNSDTIVKNYNYERDIKNCINNKGTSTRFPQSGCNVWNGNDATWIGKISLMYPSDIGYAVNNYWYYTYWSELYNYLTASTTWMRVNGSWLLSPSSDRQYAVTCMSVAYSYVYYSDLGILPLLNIKSDVKIASGTGTSTDPYIFTK